MKMAGWTNRGKRNALGVLFNGETLPTNFYMALATSATAPTQDTNTFGQLTEIAAGNGYTTGGYSLTKNTTDFPGLNEDDTGDLGEIDVGPAAGIVWTASGGSIPDSGDGARYAVLIDDDGTVANREVWFYWDLTSDRSVSSGQTLTLTGGSGEIRITQT